MQGILYTMGCIEAQRRANVCFELLVAVLMNQEELSRLNLGSMHGIK